MIKLALLAAFIMTLYCQACVLWSIFPPTSWLSTILWANSCKLFSSCALLQSLTALQCLFILFPHLFQRKFFLTFQRLASQAAGPGPMASSNPCLTYRCKRPTPTCARLGTIPVWGLRCLMSLMRDLMRSHNNLDLILFLI